MHDTKSRHQWLSPASSLFRFWTSARASCSKRCVNWMLCRICSEGRSTWCCKSWKRRVLWSGIWWMNLLEILAGWDLHKIFMFEVCSVGFLYVLITFTYSCWFAGLFWENPQIPGFAPSAIPQFGSESRPSFSGGFALVVRYAVYLRQSTTFTSPQSSQNFSWFNDATMGNQTLQSLSYYWILWSYDVPWYIWYTLYLYIMYSISLVIFPPKSFACLQVHNGLRVSDDWVVLSFGGSLPSISLPRMLLGGPLCKEVQNLTKCACQLDNVSQMWV